MAIEEPPFIVHIAGPDDIENFLSWQEACVRAHEVNEAIVGYVKVTTNGIAPRAWATPYRRSDAVEAGVI